MLKYVFILTPGEGVRDIIDNMFNAVYNFYVMFEQLHITRQISKICTHMNKHDIALCTLARSLLSPNMHDTLC